MSLMEADEAIKYLIRERKILENSIKLLSGDKLLNGTEKAVTAKVKGDIHKTIAIFRLREIAELLFNANALIVE